MKRLIPALLLCATGSAFAWGTAGLAYYQTYQNGAPMPPAAQQPVNTTDSYNQGYQDGYNASHGYDKRHGYGDHYDEGYAAGFRAGRQ